LARCHKGRRGADLIQDHDRVWLDLSPAPLVFVETGGGNCIEQTSSTLLRESCRRFGPSGSWTACRVNDDGAPAKLKDDFVGQASLLDHRFGYANASRIADANEQGVPGLLTVSRESIASSSSRAGTSPDNRPFRATEHRFSQRRGEPVSRGGLSRLGQKLRHKLPRIFVIAVFEILMSLFELLFECGSFFWIHFSERIDDPR
jgi:hypothetical protein